MPRIEYQTRQVHAMYPESNKQFTNLLMERHLVTCLTSRRLVNWVSDILYIPFFSFNLLHLIQANIDGVTELDRLQSGPVALCEIRRYQKRQVGYLQTPLPTTCP
jgi:hypothetical protein